MKICLCHIYQKIIEGLQRLDFIPLLALRIYLAPIFIIAGWNKYQNFDDMVEWYGNADWGLGLPIPVVMVSLSIAAELIGGFALLFGVLTRFFSLSLLITMIVAIVKVHWQNGWFAIAPTDPETSTAKFFSFLGFPQADQSLANSLEVSERLDKARELLQENGNYDWLTETGNFVILNNGIEFAMTYLIMLFILLIYGAGKFVSIDHYFSKYVYKKVKCDGSRYR